MKNIYTLIGTKEVSLRYFYLAFASFLPVLVEATFSETQTSLPANQAYSTTCNSSMHQAPTLTGLIGMADVAVPSAETKKDQAITAPDDRTSMHVLNNGGGYY